MNLQDNKIASIVIISALPMETQAFIALLLKTEIKSIAGIEYYEGYIKNLRCVVFTAGIGQAYTAAMTALTIHSMRIAEILGSLDT